MPTLENRSAQLHPKAYVGSGLQLPEILPFGLYKNPAYKLHVVCDGRLRLVFPTKASRVIGSVP